MRDDGHLGSLAAVAAEVDQAMEVWRRVVLREVVSAGQYEQHILLLDAVASTTVPDFPPSLNRFIKLTIGIKPYYFRNAGYVITKLCRRLVVGAIVNT